MIEQQVFSVFGIVIVIAFLAARRNARASTPRVRHTLRRVVSKPPTNRSPDQPFRWTDLPFLSFAVTPTQVIAELDQFQGTIGLNSEQRPSTAQHRYLPQYRSQLEVISIDETEFHVRGKLLAKPDAVFYDAEQNELLIVEYKSWEYWAPGSIKPADAFQLLFAAEVMLWLLNRTKYVSRFSTEQVPSVRTFIRMNNAVIELTGWQGRLKALRSFAEDLFAVSEFTSIGSRKIAEHFVAYEPVFKPTPTPEQCRLFGKIKHLRMAGQKQEIW